MLHVHRHTHSDERRSCLMHFLHLHPKSSKNKHISRVNDPLVYVNCSSSRCSFSSPAFPCHFALPPSVAAGLLRALLAETPSAGWSYCCSLTSSLFWHWWFLWHGRASLEWRAKPHHCWKVCVCRGHVSIALGTAPTGSEGKRGSGALPISIWCCGCWRKHLDLSSSKQVSSVHVNFYKMLTGEQATAVIYPVVHMYQHITPRRRECCHSGKLCVSKFTWERYEGR